MFGPANQTNGRDAEPIREALWIEILNEEYQYSDSGESLQNNLLRYVAVNGKTAFLKICAEISRSEDEQAASRLAHAIHTRAKEVPMA